MKQILEAPVGAEVIDTQIRFDVPGNFQKFLLVSSLQELEGSVLLAWDYPSIRTPGFPKVDGGEYLSIFTGPRSLKTYYDNCSISSLRDFPHC